MRWLFGNGGLTRLGVADFTVAIPTRARPDMLARAIGSAVAQRGACFDVLVIDDGAGEGLEVAAQFGARAVSNGGAGQVAARNRAVALCATPYLAWLDDDDYWQDGSHLARAAAAFEAGAAFWFAGGDLVAPGEATVAFSPQVTVASLASDNGILVSALCYRRNLHDRLGLFDEALPIYWDWDWSLRVARSGAPMVQDHTLSAVIRRHPGNVTGAGHDDLRRADLDRLAAKHGLGPLVLKTHRDLVP